MAREPQRRKPKHYLLSLSSRIKVLTAQVSEKSQCKHDQIYTTGEEADHRARLIIIIIIINNHVLHQEDIFLFLPNNIQRCAVSLRRLPSLLLVQFLV